MTALDLSTLVDNGGWPYSTCVYDDVNDELDVSFYRERLINGDGGKHITIPAPVTTDEPWLEMDVEWVSGTAPDQFATTMFTFLAPQAASVSGGAVTYGSPRIGIEFAWDTDAHASRGVRGFFYNSTGTPTYGTAYTTWGTLPLERNLRAWVSGLTGYFSVDGAAPATVALTGSFSAKWTHWQLPPREGTTTDDGTSDGQVFEFKRIQTVDVWTAGADSPMVI